jgi:hypothetical protein
VTRLKITHYRPAQSFGVDHLGINVARFIDRAFAITLVAPADDPRPARSERPKNLNARSMRLNRIWC